MDLSDQTLRSARNSTTCQPTQNQLRRLTRLQKGDYNPNDSPQAQVLAACGLEK